jgi:hypothetical protein
MKKELKNTDFSKDTMASELNLSGVIHSSSLHELINKLNGNRNGYEEYVEGSIMNYGEICDCDALYLCEHRIQWVVDFIKKNYVQHPLTPKRDTLIKK